MSYLIKSKYVEGKVNLVFNFLKHFLTVKELLGQNLKVESD